MQRWMLQGCENVINFSGHEKVVIHAYFKMQTIVYAV
jgi:hypothetical protein